MANTTLKLEVGVLTAEVEVDYSIGRGYMGGPTNYRWEPDEAGELEIESIDLLELRDKNGKEINLDSKRVKKLEKWLGEKYDEQISEKCYEPDFGGDF